MIHLEIYFYLVCYMYLEVIFFNCDSQSSQVSKLKKNNRETDLQISNSRLYKIVRI